MPVRTPQENIEREDRETRKQNARKLLAMAGYAKDLDPAYPERSDHEIYARWRFTPVFRVAVAAAIAAGLAGCGTTWSAVHRTFALMLGKVEFWASLQSVELMRSLVVAGVVAVLATLTAALWARRRSLIVTASIVFLVAFGVISGSVYAYAGIERKAELERIGDLLAKTYWISYEPTETDPDHPEKKIPYEHIRDELRPLHDWAHFDGLITFTFSEPMIRAAQEVGFTKAIVGIGVPRPEDNAGRIVKPQEAMDRLVAFVQSNPKSIITAICLGHQVSLQVPLDTLFEWEEELREATGLPVTTTFSIASYIGDRGARVRMCSDFLFPDVSSGFGDDEETFSPTIAIERTRRSIELIASLDEKKPCLCKIVAYPSGGGDGFTIDNQRKFWTTTTRDLYLPPGVHIGVFSAYDIPFRASGRNAVRATTMPASASATQPLPRWSAPEEFTGLITAPMYDSKGKCIQLGKPKPAFWVLAQRWAINARP